MILARLFLAFFKVGLFTFGGGYAMIPLFEKEIVEKYRWLSMDEFADIMAIAEMTPGPFAINTATFVGYKTAKFLGAAVSTLGMVLPSFIVILAIAALFLNFQNNPVVRSAFNALRPAIVGLIIVAALRLGGVAIKGFGSILVMLLVVTSVYIFKVNPILVLLAAAVAGILFFR